MLIITPREDFVIILASKPESSTIKTPMTADPFMTSSILTVFEVTEKARRIMKG